MSTARQAHKSDQSYFRLEASKSAILVIDMQNGFLEPGARLEVPAGRDIIPNIDRLIQHCRNENVPVIWIQLDSSEPYGGILLDKYPPLRTEKVLYKGTHSFELFKDMPTPVAGDHVVTKHKYDAFYETDLNGLLNNLGRDTLIITGVTSNCCCESTARSAFERDYKVAFIDDATAAFEQRLHEATLGTINELFGRVMSTEDVVNEL